MSTQNTNRRLTPATIHQDITAYNGLQTIEGYSTTRPDATPEALKSAYENMLVKQREAVEKEVLFKAAAAVGFKKKSERKRPSKKKD